MNTTPPINPDGVAPKQAAHTSGPWTIGERINRALAVIGRGEIVSGVIATIDCGWSHEDQQREQEANARLIAAAPELLDALAFLLSEMPDRALEYGEDDFNRAMQQSRDAVAKAKGSK